MIISLYIADQPGHQRRKVQTATVVAGSGLVGDRNYGRSEWPGQNITFIAIEEINAYNLRYAQNFDAWMFGRNVVTQGIQLTDLVGQTFSTGTARFRGVELCEPCATLGGYIANSTMSADQCVRALLHRAGLRADVIADGTLKQGMKLSIDE